MSQPAQQMSLLLEGDEQPLDAGQLIIPPEQLSRLREGGGDYIEDFITPKEEDALLAEVDAANTEWLYDLKRRVQHYGYCYDYAERNIKSEHWLGTLPPWVDKVVKRLMKRKIFESQPDQLIVNEYEPKQGIAPHTDRNCFGPTVASLSLGSDCMMTIRPDRKNKSAAFEIVLRRRSLVVFRGKSRDVWKHGIAPRIKDAQNGYKVLRDRRVSLTFRTVKHECVT